MWVKSIIIYVDVVIYVDDYEMVMWVKSIIIYVDVVIYVDENEIDMGVNLLSCMLICVDNVILTRE